MQHDLTTFVAIINKHGWRVISLGQIAEMWTCRLQYFTPSGASSDVFSFAEAETMEQAVEIAYKDGRRRLDLPKVDTKLPTAPKGRNAPRKVEIVDRPGSDDREDYL